MPNYVVLSSALYMLMKFGCVNDAEQLFESIRTKDVSSYGIMMKDEYFSYISQLHIFYLGYLHNRLPDKALDLFERMPLTPNGMVYSTVFQANAELLENEASLSELNFFIRSQVNQQ